MKILGNRVLIEHKSERIKRAIHVLGQDSDNAVFDTTFTVLGLGTDVPPDVIQVGNKVVLGAHTQPNLVDTVKKTNDSNIYNVIVHYDDIEAIYEPEDLKKNGTK